MRAKRFRIERAQAKWPEGRVNAAREVKIRVEMTKAKGKAQG